MKEGPATPRCAHFGTCGGCQFQDIAYSEQVQRKSEELSRLFGRPVEVVPSPKPYEYRNRMDFVCAFGKVGLRERGHFQKVVDIERCHLVDGRVSELLNALRAEQRRCGIEDYHYLSHQGYLRYIVFRHAQGTGELMVAFVTATPEDRLGPLFDAVRDKVQSACWLVQPEKGDHSFGRPVKFEGRDHLIERAGGLSFKFGPNTFFQNNASLVSALFDFVRAHARGRVLDLYCGVGALSLAVAAAGSAEHVTGVEQVEESIRFAKENALLNSTGPVEFVSQEVRQWLIGNAHRAGEFDTIIVDPPRSGLGGKVARKIGRLAPKTIVYVSCNPKTMVEDMAWWKDQYSIADLRGFDMFPQTGHVEGVGVFHNAAVSN